MITLALKKGIWQEVGAIAHTSQMAASASIVEIAEEAALPAGDVASSMTILQGVPLYWSVPAVGTYFVRCITGDCNYTFVEH